MSLWVVWALQEEDNQVISTESGRKGVGRKEALNWTSRLKYLQMHKSLLSPVEMCLRGSSLISTLGRLKTDIFIILIGDICRYHKFHIYLWESLQPTDKSLWSAYKRLKCINTLKAKQKKFASFSPCHEGGCLRQYEKQLFFFLHLFWSFTVHCYNNSPIHFLNRFVKDLCF